MGDFMEHNYAEMGKRIAIRRKQLRLKQNDLAEKIGISNNHLSNIECGKSVPSLDVFMDICNELKVTPDYLLIGIRRSGMVPKAISDGLGLCAPEDLDMLYQIEQIMIHRNSEKWNQENFV